MRGLNLDSVVKDVDGRRVLDGVSISAGPGEILAVVGASGTGKSTLLRTINRLTEIDGGHILLDHVSIHQLDPVMLRRKVGMVFQIPALFDGTIMDNVSYGLGLQNIHSTKRVREAVKAAHLPLGYLNRDAQKLSVGEQQRVAIARVLALEPQVILLDEPTASLDERSTRKVEATITDLLRKRGLIILWVTHDMRQAKRVGTRIARLKDGKVRMFENDTRGGI